MNSTPKQKQHFENVIVLLMGIAGTGKRTIAQAMNAHDHSFRVVLNDSWINPILNLLGDEPTVMNSLTPAGWAAIHKSCDVVFDTITYVCPKESNFVITNELLEGNTWHQDFYKKVELMVKNRNAIFVPIRLTCDIPTLLKRVVSEDRKNFYKTLDAELVKERALNNQVFRSNHKNEFTLDTTGLSPKESADNIFRHLAHLLNEKTEL